MSAQVNKVINSVYVVYKLKMHDVKFQAFCLNNCVYVVSISIQHLIGNFVFVWLCSAFSFNF